MGKVIRARYNAHEKVLRLAEPLEGVSDDTDVAVNVIPLPQNSPHSLEGSLSAEAGEDLARSIDRLFGDDE